MKKIKNANVIRIFVGFAVVIVFSLAAYFIEGMIISAQNQSDETKTANEEISLQQPSRNSDEDDDCTGAPVRLPATKLFIEHNSTAEDTGVHGFFDGIDWTELEIYDPRGRQILGVEPLRQLRTQSISGIFFESAEPPNDEVPISEIFRRFPQGLYSVRGCTADGRRMTGAATFTHNIPAAPVIVFPQDGDQVPSSNLTVMWNHVTTTLDGRPLNRTGYEVILTKQVPDDPNGFSRPALSIHVPPSVTSLTVPNQFLQSASRYEIEIIVLEVSGNQTISSIFFETN